MKGREGPDASYGKQQNQMGDITIGDSELPHAIDPRNSGRGRPSHTHSTRALTELGTLHDAPSKARDSDTPATPAKHEVMVAWGDEPWNRNRIYGHQVAIIDGRGFIGPERRPRLEDYKRNRIRIATPPTFGEQVPREAPEGTY